MGALCAAIAVTLAGPAFAQKARRITVEIVVNQVSSRPGPIAPDARELHHRLHKQFRYESLRVLERKRLRLALDEIGGLRLPNGRWVRVRPLDLHGDRVLMAVEVEGALQTDLRMKNRKVVVIGAQPYQDGKLVITLKPTF